MTTKIFISYRRDDSQTEASLIYGMLQERFGKDAVFMDKSTIKPGDKWAAKIECDLVEAKVVLVIIKDKKTWLGVDEDGFRRIEEEGDWIRQELELAIKEGKEVVPLLVKGGELPPEKALPESLRILLGFHALAIDFDDSWEQDQQKVVDACKNKLEQSGISVRQPLDRSALVKKFGPFGLLAAAIYAAESNKSFRTHINQHQDDLCKFVETVRAVRETKELHDIAHFVQVDGLGPFRRKLMGSLSEDLEWEFPDEHDLIQDALKELQALQSKNESIGDWVKDFLVCLIGLDTAIRNDDIDLLKTEVHKLDSLLKKQQMALNKRLIDLVDHDLHLVEVTDEVVAALKLVASSSESDQGSEISSISENLCTFRDEFLWLKDIHNRWQDIDKELSHLETLLSHPNSVNDTIYALSVVKGRLEEIFKKREPVELSNLVTRMRDNQNKLNDQLLRASTEGPNTKDLQRTLIKFSDPARKIFRAIDSSLKKKCRDLVKLEGVIKELLLAPNQSGGQDCA